LATPVRLQLSRRQGFNLADLSRATNGLESVVVSRPSKWGNPYRIEEFGRDRSLALYRDYVAKRLKHGKPRLDLSELRGKNLACWCAEDERCHADILLELANGARSVEETG